MPTDATGLSLIRDVKDLQRLSRRHQNLSVSGAPFWDYQEFTTAGPNTLRYLPVNLSPHVELNGVGLREGTDYTWNYATGVITLTATFTAGDHLMVRYQTTGLQKVAATAPNVGTVTDNFNRANSSSLGTATTGQSWVVVARGTWGISGNVAVVQTTRAGDNDAISWIETGSSDGVAQMTLTARGGGIGLLLRASSTENWWLADAFGLVKAVNNAFTRSVSFAASLGAGTVLAVTLSGNTIDITANGTRPACTTGSLPWTDSFNNTATKHGIYGGTGTQADDWSWTA